MKFCKNLQQIVEISNPEWAPYWTNYKMLKKLIKELPSLVPQDSKDKKVDQSNPDIQNKQTKPLPKETKKKDMGKSPGEIAFFKLLHSELQKGSKFFEKIKKEFVVREARVQEGYEIMKKPNSIMVADKWSTVAKSIDSFYKDLMLLELYAIMTYCSFSKILKKHDKNTGYDTRIAFMANVVNKASFTHYPEILEMIQRSEVLFEEVSQKLLIEGNSALCEDERLFISMIHRFYGQILDKAAEEGAPDTDVRKEASNKMRQVMANKPLSINASQTAKSRNNEDSPSPTRNDANSLQNLVEENDASAVATRTCLSDDPDDESITPMTKSAKLKRSYKNSDERDGVETGKRPKVTENE